MTKPKGSMTMSNSPNLNQHTNKRKNSHSKTEAAKTVNKTDIKKNITHDNEIIDCNICKSDVDELSIQ